jgi:hypothetical protein
MSIRGPGVPSADASHSNPGFKRRKVAELNVQGTSRTCPGWRPYSFARRKRKNVLFEHLRRRPAPRPPRRRTTPENPRLFRPRHDRRRPPWGGPSRRPCKDSRSRRRQIPDAARASDVIERARQRRPGSGPKYWRRCPPHARPGSLIPPCELPLRWMSPLGTSRPTCRRRCHEALRRIRDGGHQHVRVEHIHGHDAGQAVVGEMPSSWRQGPD